MGYHIFLISQKTKFVTCLKFLEEKFLPYLGRSVSKGIVMNSAPLSIKTTDFLLKRRGSILISVGSEPKLEDIGYHKDFHFH